jgi:hypothetical protein
MSSVVMMLVSESLLPGTNEPGFILGKKSLNHDQLSSTNEITVSLLEAR